MWYSRLIYPSLVFLWLLWMFFTLLLRCYMVRRIYDIVCCVGPICAIICPNWVSWMCFLWLICCDISSQLSLGRFDRHWPETIMAVACGIHLYLRFHTVVEPSNYGKDILFSSWQWLQAWDRPRKQRLTTRPAR